MKILAKDYTTRQALDDYVRNELGDNIDANRLAGHSIEGTALELINLQLSPNNRVFGVKVLLTNS